MFCGKKIVIRVLEEKHLELLRGLRNDFQNTSKFLTVSVPINEISQKKWYESVSTDGSKMYMAIEDKKGAFVGIVRADEWDKINGSIRVGVDIVPERRGEGLATDAYTVLLSYLFNNLRIHRVWLEVLDYNKVAIRLYKKIGFVEEGRLREAVYKNGSFSDYIVMSILKKEYDGKKND